MAGSTITKRITASTRSIGKTAGSPCLANRILISFFIVFFLSIAFVSHPLCATSSKKTRQLLSPPQKYADRDLTKILRKISLVYYPGMKPADREADFREKIKRVYELVGVEHMYELRERAAKLIEMHRIPWSWERFRRLRTPGRNRMGIWLTIPVWIPYGSRRIGTYGGFKRKWEDVTRKDRFLGYVYFCSSLKKVNDKRHYRAGTLTFETSREFAPFAYLFFQYIFREGLCEISLRVPIMSVRSGEDTYAAAGLRRSPTFSCAEFRDEINGDFKHRVVKKECESYSEIIHGHHKGRSNHRIGCAMDINSFDFPDVKDGSPNPISRAKRQYKRDLLHEIDARNLPEWVFTAAEEIGFRVPYQWSYGWGFTDWHHFDCGREPKVDEKAVTRESKR